MAHFAQIDENNVVTRVIVVANTELLDSDGNESEAKGISFCQSLFGADTRWVQTSYNGNFRNCYAGIDFTYDPVLDIFIPPQPFPSWTLDSSKIKWNPPTPRPNDGNNYYWNEPSLSWVLV